MNLFFIIRNRSKINKTREVPVYVRLRDSGIDLWQNTGITVTPDWWDRKAEKLKSRIILPCEFRDNFDNNISSMRTYIKEHHRMESSKKVINKEWLAGVVSDFAKEKEKAAPKQKKVCFVELFDKFLKEHQMSESRKEQQMVVRNAILRYETFNRKTGHKGFKFDVKNIDEEELVKLWNFLKNEHSLKEEYPEVFDEILDNMELRRKQKKILERSQNTMIGYFKRLKVFFSFCKEKGIISNNPFDDFPIPSERYGTPFYLTKEELHYLADFDLKEPSLERQRDIFVFQCCVGTRVGDLIKLKKTDIINGALEYVPEKTMRESQRTVVVPLNETAKKIVEKYSEMNGDRLLPFISDVKYNVLIKDIFSKVGLTRLVSWLNPNTQKEEKRPLNEIASSHMARRTFIGNLYKQVLDPNIVASLSGHSEGSRAFSRYREIDKDIKTNVVKLLD